MRYTESRCRRCRALGASICGRAKCAFLKRGTAPGQHGAARKKVSDFGKHLQAKQKIKWTYEVSERQFFNLYQQAIRSRGITGDVLLQLLELRIDNVVYRAFSCSTRRQARQLVSHGHVRVNGKKLDIPSALVKPGDTISVAGGMHSYLKERQPSLGIVPAWLQADYGNMTASCLHIPSREDIDQTFEENLVIEYYSR
ncbi:MAG: 30S ribosomal protein S4 [Candidatus Obscuribacterales bacterium]